MLKTFAFAVLPLLIFFGFGTNYLMNGVEDTAQIPGNGPTATSGTVEKLIVASGNVSMDIDMNRLGGALARSKGTSTGELRFEVEPDTFFTIMTLNGELRGPLPSTMPIIATESAVFPGSLNASYQSLVVENTLPGEAYEFAVRDAKSGFTFFNIEGHEYSYDGNTRELNIKGGRMLLSPEYASELGRADEAGKIYGHININATMRPIEVQQVIEDEVVSNVLPGTSPEAGGVPGPDVIVGDVIGLAQFGSAAGTQVGLAVGTDSCNAGVVDLNWFALPSNDHPVIPQNMYRMSGGGSNDLYFEQIGQSSMKHAFTALTQNLCGFGCNGVGGSRLGSGCSDPYSASLNAGPSLGSRAWVNPFTGAYPRGDSATPPNSHTGHSHLGPSHRILTEIVDLRTDLNPGASYYAEAQYVTPHEYAWCQSNPGQCNMYNNVSYRRYNVTGTGSPFSFSANGATVRTKPAIYAWPGASIVQFEPAPGSDGIGFIAYKVTQTGANTWHYEYAVYNQNLDRSIGGFSVPTNGATLSNIGFHAPPQHPAWTADGTVGSAGYSSTPWQALENAGTIAWTTETFAANPNANAIRWGTMYNFRFTSNRPPQNGNATLGFYKTGSPIAVAVQVPSAAPSSSVSVGGRVTSQNGYGVNNARVYINDGQGGVRIAVTNSFGYYRFDNVITGAQYTFSVESKRFTFTPQVVTVNEQLTELNFVSQQ